jgi:hypothetical protein
VFLANIEDVAAENRLYEFSFQGATGSIEEGLARFESIVASTVARIVLLDSIGQMAADDREVLGAFVGS